MSLVRHSQGSNPWPSTLEAIKNANQYTTKADVILENSGSFEKFSFTFTASAVDKDTQ